MKRKTGHIENGSRSAGGGLKPAPMAMETMAGIANRSPSHPRPFGRLWQACLTTVGLLDAGAENGFFDAESRFGADSGEAVFGSETGSHLERAHKVCGMLAKIRSMMIHKSFH